MGSFDVFKHRCIDYLLLMFPNINSNLCIELQSFLVHIWNLYLIFLTQILLLNGNWGCYVPQTFLTDIKHDHSQKSPLNITGDLIGWS
jgi:hypothetical protein